MNRKLVYNVPGDCSGLTIEKYLKTKGFSSANITAIKKMPRNVEIDGEWIHMNRKLIGGEELVVNIHEEESSENIVPTYMPLDIVYEDEDIIVINKPAGCSIHPSINHFEDSLANALAYYYQKKGEAFIFRCANRLDKNTSGLTVVSKHLVAANILSTAVKNREFHREYRAIVRGHLTPASGIIDAPIARVDDSIITRTVNFERGEQAITHYKVIDEKNGHSLVSIHLETGRTHQIRVHFKYIGFPLVGDHLYNPDMELISRQALHSYKIKFAHPITGEQMDFIAKLPNDMQSILHE